MQQFSLQVYAEDVTLLGNSVAQAPSHLALAYQFLDYPLLLVYPRAVAAAWTDASTHGTQVLFKSGKACILEADAGELSFLTGQVQLHITDPRLPIQKLTAS